MNRQLDRETLSKLLQAEDIESLSFLELVRLFQEEKELLQFLPDGVYQIDPRNGDRIIYNSSRARRPHDNRPTQSSPTDSGQECIICQGRTTGVIDVADLSQGLTFINKNLFPVLYPLESVRPDSTMDRRGQVPGPEGGPTYGFHFLQWTSSYHDRDWHNMPRSDRVVVMKRLAALEKRLLNDLPAADSGRHGFVLIMKNHGRLVGGSLSHGHQQIALSNVMPRRVQDNWRFETERGEPFSAYLLRGNPSELTVEDYGPAILLVPYFMRRPYDMMLLLKDASKRHLHQLTEAEIGAVAEGWRDAIRAMRQVLAEIGRELAYNVIAHNGPGAGIYFEFLPYTQETGGFEHLGLYVCQQSPKTAALRIRELLGEEGAHQGAEGDAAT
jgi:galactose-1-phosphate uridylyltransferase